MKLNYYCPTVLDGMCESVIKHNMPILSHGPHFCASAPGNCLDLVLDTNKVQEALNNSSCDSFRAFITAFGIHLARKLFSVPHLVFLLPQVSTSSDYTESDSLFFYLIVVGCLPLHREWYILFLSNNDSWQQLCMYNIM